VLFAIAVGAVYAPVSPIQAVASFVGIVVVSVAIGLATGFAAAKVIGLRAAAIVASGVDTELDPDLTPAGRLVTAEAPDLPAPVAALLGSATPLQLMTERLARARGTNPDLIRREDPVYLAAADAAEA